MTFLFPLLFTYKSLKWRCQKPNNEPVKCSLPFRASLFSLSSNPQLCVSFYRFSPTRKKNSLPYKDPNNQPTCFVLSSSTYSFLLSLNPDSIRNNIILSSFFSFRKEGPPPMGMTGEQLLLLLQFPFKGEDERVCSLFSLCGVRYAYCIQPHETV